MKIVIAGASGLIGQALSKKLGEEGHEVHSLVRRKSAAELEISWDPYEKTIELEKLEDSDACICLSGENIASGRWTEAKKKRLIESRVESNSFLIASLSKLNKKPKTYISASAIGIYKPKDGDAHTEEGAFGNLFISEICKAWEQASSQASQLGMRTLQTRIGIVLTPDGGALEKMYLPFYLGLGGPVGDGTQMMSWISLEDVCRAFSYVLNNDTISGPVNVCSPKPISNEKFSKTLAKVLGRPCIFRVPTFVVSLLFGEMGEQLLLASLPVSPAKLESHAFVFQDTNLQKTLDSLLNS